ncbi:hypothetical protein AAC387_Pa01g2393 [Persea americana]
MFSFPSRKLPSPTALTSVAIPEPSAVKVEAPNGFVAYHTTPQFKTQQWRWGNSGGLQDALGFDQEPLSVLTR